MATIFCLFIHPPFLFLSDMYSSSAFNRKLCSLQSWRPNIGVLLFVMLQALPVLTSWRRHCWCRWLAVTMTEVTCRAYTCNMKGKGSFTLSAFAQKLCHFCCGTHATYRTHGDNFCTRQCILISNQRIMYVITSRCLTKMYMLINVAENFTVGIKLNMSMWTALKTIGTLHSFVWPLLWIVYHRDTDRHCLLTNTTNRTTDERACSAV